MGERTAQLKAAKAKDAEAKAIAKAKAFTFPDQIYKVPIRGQQTPKYYKMEERKWFLYRYQDLPAGWETRTDPSSDRTYYVSPPPRKSQWARPGGVWVEYAPSDQELVKILETVA